MGTAGQDPLVSALLSYEGIRRMVRAERAHLATLGFEHRGADSFLWGEG